MSDAVLTEAPLPPNQFEIEAREGLNSTGFEYFDNFELLFPSDKHNSFANKRKLMKERGREDRKISEDYPTEIAGKEFSSLWLDQTWGEYFETIDKAMEEEGVSADEIKSMRNYLATELDDQARLPVRHQMLEKLIPVFVNLRKKGYTHDDLTV